MAVKTTDSHGALRVSAPEAEVVALSEAIMPSIVIHESCRDIGLEVCQSPQILFVVKTDSQVTLTQLRNESVTTRSRPFANKFSFARDMCYGTSMHPASVKEPLMLCGTYPTTVVPTEQYVEELWTALDLTLQHSSCGSPSDTPVGKGGTLNMDDFAIVGAPAPVKNPEPRNLSIPPPPEPLPEMKDAAIVKNVIKALSPRIIAVHGPTGTGKSTVFPLAITHWTERAKGLTSGLTVRAQPRRILAQQLWERVRSNRKMHYKDRTVGYMIARESSRDTSTKLHYCTEAIVALMMQARLASSSPPLGKF